jgi:hypothetical protein
MTRAAGPADFSSRGDTAHAPLIQVGTPSLGRSQRLSTNHATMKAMKNQSSDMLIFRSNSATSSFEGDSH